MSIAEALEKVVGKDYRTQLIEFEKSKLNQIHEYIQHADVSCISVLHNRLMIFMNFMHSKDKGVFPLAFGTDIRSGMSQEELGFIDRSYEMWLNNRYSNNQKEVAVYKECLDLVTRSKNRNAKLVQYKLETLPESMVTLLYDKVLEFKVFQQKKFEDLDQLFCEPKVLQYVTVEGGDGGQS